MKLLRKLPPLEFKNAFTLAEVLITLAIIGVVAAITIPSVIVNTQQSEFKTGLKKAVSALNSAITMNMSEDGESPYDNENTFVYLQRHMSILKSTGRLPFRSQYRSQSTGMVTASNWNAAFYTTDGMRFETEDVCLSGTTSCRQGPKLHESDTHTCILSSGINNDYYIEGHDDMITAGDTNKDGTCGGCGSLGLSSNPNNTSKPPCLILVDVNGDRKPTPANAYCNQSDCEKSNIYKYPLPSSNKLSDIFTIMITEDRAVPFGVVAQRAMYNSRQTQKK